MSILTKHEIEKERLLGNITIEPFNPNFLGPNSMDVTLHPVLKTYYPIDLGSVNFGDGEVKVARFSTEAMVSKPLDLSKENPTYEFEIPEEGVLLIPGILYLGSTNEVAGSDHYVPMYEGRSSIGRLGIHSHVSAGFGDIGFRTNWTLEITVIHPVIVYRNARIGQVYFIRVEDEGLIQLVESGDLYKGKYGEQVLAQSSKSHLDYTRDQDNKILMNNFR